MTVTSVPFMEVYDEEENSDWCILECELCWPDWRTHDGRLYVCEEQAYEHLEEVHPRRYQIESDRRRLLRKHYKYRVQEDYPYAL